MKRGVVSDVEEWPLSDAVDAVRCELTGSWRGMQPGRDKVMEDGLEPTISNVFDSIPYQFSYINESLRLARHQYFSYLTTYCSLSYPFQGEVCSSCSRSPLYFDLSLEKARDLAFLSRRSAFLSIVMIINGANLSLEKARDLSFLFRRSASLSIVMITNNAFQMSLTRLKGISYAFMRF